MSRVARSAALTEIVTCQLMIRGLERQAIENPPRSLDAQRAAHEVRLRAYRAYARAAAAAAPGYREGSAARLLADATATALHMIVAAMQRELDRTTAGA